VKLCFSFLKFLTGRILDMQIAHFTDFTISRFLNLCPIVIAKNHNFILQLWLLVFLLLDVFPFLDFFNFSLVRMNQNESLIDGVSHCFEPNHRTDINDRKNERIILKLWNRQSWTRNRDLRTSRSADNWVRSTGLEFFLVRIRSGSHGPLGPTFRSVDPWLGTADSTARL